MPVTNNKDDKGCYSQWGNQTKYYYECGNETQRTEAMKKAMAQAIAASRNGAKENKLKSDKEKNI